MAGIITSIDPTALAAGPPVDTVLHVYGTGFEATSQIRFGGVLERTDHYPDGRHLSTVISQGVFPGPGDVAVSVFNPSDASDSNVVTFTFLVAAVMPADGTLVADLTELKIYIGARTAQDDDLLQACLDTASRHIYERVREDHWMHVDVQMALLLQASRMYKRRQAPEGVAGWGGELRQSNVAQWDPDVLALIERYLDWSNVGLG